MLYWGRDAILPVPRTLTRETLATLFGALGYIVLSASRASVRGYTRGMALAML